MISDYEWSIADGEPDWGVVQRIAAFARDTYALDSDFKPAPDDTWPDLWRLRWKAAVINGRNGTSLAVYDRAVENSLQQFRITYGWTSAGPFAAETAANILDGIALGFAWAGEKGRS